MSETQQHSIGKEVQAWVQTAGILVAFAWGAWTFYFKEIVTPSSAPVNLSISMQLQEGGRKTSGGDKNKPLMEAVLMKATATNPSSRTIYLLPNMFAIYGRKISLLDEGESEVRKRLQDGVDYVNHNTGSASYYGARHAIDGDSSMIAFGTLFADRALQPKETVTRTELIYIPQNVYDSLDLFSLVPTHDQRDELEFEWILNDDNTVGGRWYRVASDGKRTPLPLDKSGEVADKRIRNEVYGTLYKLSLWH